jgi:methylglyoxal synthase
MPHVRTLILIAHERMTPGLIKLMRRRIEVFQHYRLLATTETGEAIERDLDLEVTHLFSGRRGGELQLCGLICTNTIGAVFFLRDPVNPRHDEPDITPFYRACDLNNVPLATNLVTAVALTTWLGRKVEKESENDERVASKLTEAAAS